MQNSCLKVLSYLVIKYQKSLILQWQAFTFSSFLPSPLAAINLNVDWNGLKHEGGSKEVIIINIVSVLDYNSNPIRELL